MNQERLMQGPLPMNRLALRVVRPAAKEDTWQPMPKQQVTKQFSRNFIATKELTINAPPIIGLRRGRMTVIGLAEEQPESGLRTRWVVRCDCGNYETRKRILRWLGTEATDMCDECKVRTHRISGGRSPSLAPAKRATLDATKARSA